MIELTRLNGQSFRVNCDLIKSSEASPDTVLTLVTGEKLVVEQTPEQVSEAILRYRAQVLRAAWPDAATGLGVCSVREALAQKNGFSKDAGGHEMRRAPSDDLRR